MEEIKVKYFTDDIDELCYVEGKSDWIDLHAAETVTMKAGEFRLIPLGVAIALPEGYEAHIVPRSSTFKNYGILQTNSMGVVDYTYRGDGDQWRMPAYATRDVTIEKNARICQFRIMKNQPMRVRPPEYGMTSTQASTLAPSSVIRRAMIRPMSPLPRMSTRLPTR